MVRRNEQGSSTVLIIALVLVSFLMIGAAVFGFWAYGGMQDYKNNTDQKIDTAVDVAVKKNSTKKDNEFTEKYKYPLDTYKGPETYGSVTVKYPKTWSAYVVEQSNGGTPIDGYFHPGFVPDINSKTGFALRMQVSQNQYATELNQYTEFIKIGKLKSTAYRAPGVPSVLGVRLDGTFPDTKVGSMVMFKLRDKTLKVFSLSDQYKNDFDNIILKNLKFVP